MNFDAIIYHAMLPLLENFHTWLGSYGWAIIALTLLVRVLMLPVSLKQAASTRKMQTKMAKIKPELDHLKSQFEQRKKKFSDNPQKQQELQQEFQQQMMDVYKRGGGLNPFGGCLFAILQIPIFIALYWTFNGPPFKPSIAHLTLEASQKVPTVTESGNLSSKPFNYVSDDGDLSRWQLVTDIRGEEMLVGKTYELKLRKLNGDGKLLEEKIRWQVLAKDANPHELNPRGEAPTWARDVLELQVQAGDPKHATLSVSKPTDEFHLQVVVPSGRRGHEDFFFIEDLGRIGVMDRRAAGISPSAIHWDVLVLILLTGGSFWLFNKYMMQTNPQPPTLDESQEMMQKQMQTLMPIMFLGVFFFIPVPAGIFLYLIATNVFQAMQSALLPKLMPAEEKSDDQQPPAN